MAGGGGTARWGEGGAHGGPDRRRRWTPHFDPPTSAMAWRSAPTLSPTRRRFYRGGGAVAGVGGSPRRGGGAVPGAHERPVKWAAYERRPSGTAPGALPLRRSDAELISGIGEAGTGRGSGGHRSSITQDGAYDLLEPQRRQPSPIQEPANILSRRWMPLHDNLWKDHKIAFARDWPMSRNTLNT